MLTKIVLRNFQKHHKLEIGLGRITTLVGKSDSGKSAVLRSLRLLCRNVPAGISFIRHGRKSVVVRLSVDGRDVVRKKSKAGKENAYLLDAEEFKALGQGPQGIPTAVQAVLKTDDINFSGQHDPPFWFTDPPGQVSKNLNRIVNLDVIDRVLAKAQQTARRAEAVLDVTAERVKEAEAAVKKLAWAEEFDQQLTAALAAAEKVKTYGDKITRLETLLDQYDEAVADKKQLRKVAKEGAAALLVVDKATETEDKYRRLKGLLQAYDTEREVAEKTITDFGPVEEARAEADNVAERCGRLEWLVDQLDRAEELTCQLRAEEKELLKKTRGQVSSLRTDITVLGIFAADLHISETPPVARSAEPDWFAAMSRPLEELSMLQHDLCMNEGLVPPIFYCGDIFHKWNPSPEAINFAIDTLPKGYAIAGNHDLPNHRIEDIGRSAYYTLVKNGTIVNMQAGRSFEFPGLTVVGSPFGCPLFPPPKTHDWHKTVAVVHDYCWAHGNEHPGAPLDKHVDAYAEKLQGYTAAFVGDNHSPHTAVWTKPGPLTIFNCGCLIPRRSPERHYKPRVGLFMSDGSIREHLLDTSKDVWLDEEEAARKVLADGEGVREFVDLLKRAGRATLDFRGVIHNLLSESNDKVPPEVKNEIRALLVDLD